jgi:hypothetical protein
MGTFGLGGGHGLKLPADALALARLIRRKTGKRNVNSGRSIGKISGISLHIPRENPIISINSKSYH